MSSDSHGSGTNGSDGFRPRNGSNGSHRSMAGVHPVPFSEVNEPVDLVAVQADEELINALACGVSVGATGSAYRDGEDRITAILAAWKADVDADPIPELVDVDTAVAAIRSAPGNRRRSAWARHLVPVAAAAALGVLTIGGVSVGSYNAQPEDTLWGVSKVLYGERAQSVEAAARVEQKIAAAKVALVAGEPDLAAQQLAEAESDLRAVRPQEGQESLVDTRDFLAAKAAETPPGQPADPATPLATQPTRPVPEGAKNPGPGGSPDAATSQQDGTTQRPYRPGNPGTGTPTGHGSSDPRSVDQQNSDRTERSGDRGGDTDRSRSSGGGPGDTTGVPQATTQPTAAGEAPSSGPTTSPTPTPTRAGSGDGTYSGSQGYGTPDGQPSGTGG